MSARRSWAERVHNVVISLLVLMTLEHVYFLYLEMFRWTNPATQKAFGITAAFAEESKTLAANQGLYNGFLAAGCLWAILAPPVLQRPVALFFASCVLIAGVYGGVTVTRRILYIQALPAALCLLALLAFGGA
jgi:putative membrane protein